MGDPACDLVIARTYLSGKAREIFMTEMNLDQETRLRARAWALWKATFEFCRILQGGDKESLEERHLIEEIL